MGLHLCAASAPCALVTMQQQQLHSGHHSRPPPPPATQAHPGSTTPSPTSLLIGRWTAPMAAKTQSMFRNSALGSCMGWPVLCRTTPHRSSTLPVGARVARAHPGHLLHPARLPGGLVWHPLCMSTFARGTLTNHLLMRQCLHGLPVGWTHCLQQRRTSSWQLFLRTGACWLSMMRCPQLHRPTRKAMRSSWPPGVEFLF